MPDFTFLGIHVCWMHTRKIIPRLFYSKECFHNGKQWIPGMQIELAGLGAQLSKASDWDEESQ